MAILGSTRDVSAPQHTNAGTFRDLQKQHLQVADGDRWHCAVSLRLDREDQAV